MKVLIIGSGGREHALAWKVAQSPLVEKIYCAPGNGGTAIEEKCENINKNTIEELVTFALEVQIDLTIVGPEALLVEGIVDVFEAKGLQILGPNKKAAQLEGSKAFAKEFMKKYGVKTAAYETFTEVHAAQEYIKTCAYPMVIKADGLAAGKGVVICQRREEAEKTLQDFMVEDIFKGSGKKIVIEEFLEGIEASILSITDGKTILPFLSSKDHKQIYDGNQGPNTGGMGVIAPNPYCDEKVLQAFEKDILLPTLQGIQEEEMEFAGNIFFGLMITQKGVYCLEYNIRMGDPETEAVLPLMENDYVELILAALVQKLSVCTVTWKQGYACCVIGASAGYPASYKTGYPIEIKGDLQSKLFIAGAKAAEEKLLTSGGRVLALTALGSTLEEARALAYEEMEKIHFEGIYYRKDIGTAK